MKKNYFFALFLFSILSFSATAQYSSQNISKLGHWFNPLQVAEPFYGIKYNSVWGWVDSADSNHEYAVLGAGEGTHIIDLADPTNPVQVDFVAGRRNQVIWREYKTYGKYLYAISDDSPPNSFQIIDMSYLPDSVHVVYDDNTLFEHAHTLYIDGDKMYCGSVSLLGGSGYHSLAVYSLANPELPVFLRSLSSDYPAVNYAHDMLVRNDTVYASCGYQGLFIYKYNTGANTFTELNSLTSYPNQGYNHSSAITPDGKTLVFCDEVPENKPVHIIDISDISNISLESAFKSNEGATAHNPYMWGTNKVVIAYYQDGLQIFDISNPAAPVRTGYFDTDTLHGLNDGYPTSFTYHGAWGAYIDLPSGLILTSDMQNGLYVFDASVALGVHENTVTTNSVSVFPNPASNFLSVSLKLKNAETLKFSIYDITGRKVFDKEESIGAGNTVKAFPVLQFSDGVYILKIEGTDIHYTEKIIKQ
ncbi:MAG: choice-of-anchor B family protein [Bacteroidetes bacterium]|nr:choice-of-anchor B family protein [Bacteroidota bacterium]